MSYYQAYGHCLVKFICYILQSMLTKADIKWLNHLSNSKKVKIVPYNPKLKEVFEKQKREILAILGQNVEVLHRGASGMGISGQNEIDLFIPVSLDFFDEIVNKLKKIYENPKSFYPKQRVRFNRQQDKTTIEVFVVNKDSKNWKRSTAFEDYLKSHQGALEAYGKLKESNNGIGIKEYYRQKMEFTNDIIDKAFSRN